MIPPFAPDGRLPPGIHRATWQELVDRYGGTPRRHQLLVGLERALAALRYAGCQTVYVDGSFVTAKAEPGDFDICWDSVGVDPLLLDPVLLVFDPGRATQKAMFGGEVFPAQAIADAAGSTFLEFFQIVRRTTRRKGIVAPDLRSLP